MGITDDVKSPLGAKKSAGDKIVDDAKSSVSRMADNAKGALGLKPKEDKNLGYGLLVLRIALAMMVFHGFTKLTNLDGTGAFFGKLGIPIPGVMALLIGLLEFAGGLCILAGIGTRIFGALFAIDLATAILLTNPLKGVQPHELELWFMLAGIAIALMGPGTLSLSEILSKGDKDSIFAKI
ncbi:MAG: DoxX family protein [Candidatus Micrarchaeia archaeon]